MHLAVVSGREVAVVLGPVLGPHPAPTLREHKLQSSLGVDVGWPKKGAPSERGPSITITMADVTDPTKELGPQVQSNLNPTSD